MKRLLRRFSMERPNQKSTQQGKSHYDAMNFNSGKLKSFKSQPPYPNTVVGQHMMIGQNWTPHSLSEQLSGMNKLLSHHTTYKRFEMQAKRQQNLQKIKQLKLDVLDGRNKLQNILDGNNKHKVRKILTDQQKKT